jgi:hypothetical protein
MCSLQPATCCVKRSFENLYRLLQQVGPWKAFGAGFVAGTAPGLLIGPMLFVDIN